LRAVQRKTPAWTLASPSWQPPGILAACVEPGAWQSQPTILVTGSHSYKFLIDGQRWLDDPANPRKSPDGLGGLNSMFLVSDDASSRSSDQRAQAPRPMPQGESQ